MLPPICSTILKESWLREVSALFLNKKRKRITELIQLKFLIKLIYGKSICESKGCHKKSSWT